MPTPICVLTADWHARPCNWSDHPDLRGDSYRSIYQIADYCIQNKLPLFALGDLTELRMPDLVTFGFFMDISRMLSDATVPFYYLEGQHDMSRERSLLNCHPWPIHMHRHFLTLFGVHFYGINYTTPDQLPLELNLVPSNTDVLLCHQVWRERMGNQIGRPTDASFSDVPYASLVVSGDFHAHKSTVHVGRSDQRLVAASPGSVHLKTLDEDPHKFFYLLFDDLSLQSMPLRTRPLKRLKILTDGQLQSILGEVALMPTVLDSNADKPIYHISCHDSLRDAHERLTAAFKSRAHLFLRALTDSRSSAEAPAEVDEVVMPTDSGADGPGHRLVPYLDCMELSTPVRATCTRFLTADNTEAELASFVEEALTADSNWA